MIYAGRCLSFSLQILSPLLPLKHFPLFTPVRMYLYQTLWKCGFQGLIIRSASLGEVGTAMAHPQGEYWIES